MKELTLNTTHRLPFFNATITAKRDGTSTDPLEFFNCEGVSLGFKLKTNAAGYLNCSIVGSNNDGFYVHEDAIITAVGSDGKTTSWHVKSGDTIDVFDGILYGKVVDAGYVGEDVVEIDGERRKVIFTANQEPNSKLSFLDLADIPPLNTWSEDQQTYGADIAPNIHTSLAVTVGAMTKVILVRNNKSGIIPNKSWEFSAVDVTITCELPANDNARYGHVFSISNYCGADLILTSAATGQKIGRISCGTTKQVAVTYRWFNDVTAPYFHIIGEGWCNSSTNTLDTLYIADDWSDNITFKEYKGLGNWYNVVIDTSSITTKRVMRFISNMSKPLTLKDSAGNQLGIMRRGMTIALVMEPGKLPQRFDNAIDSYFYIGQGDIDTASKKISVPVNCDGCIIDCSGLKSDAIYIVELDINHTHNTKIAFENAKAPIWFKVGTSGAYEYICCAKGTSAFLCSIAQGILTGYTCSISPFDMKNCSIENHIVTIPYFSNDCVLDLSDATLISGSRAYSSHVDKVVVKLPSYSADITPSGEICRLRINYYHENAISSHRFGIELQTADGLKIADQSDLNIVYDNDRCVKGSDVDGYKLTVFAQHISFRFAKTDAGIIPDNVTNTCYRAQNILGLT